MALRSKAKTDLLKSVPLFEHCSRRELGKIAGITDEIAVDDGKVLITEGDRGREFFVIISGEVDVRRKGRKLATLGPGTYFGEIALLSQQPRTATVTALTPLRVLVIADRAVRRPPRQDARAVAQGRPVTGGAGRGRRAWRLGPRRRVALLGATVLDRAPDQQPDPGEDRDDRQDPGDEEDGITTPFYPVETPLIHARDNSA